MSPPRPFIFMPGAAALPLLPPGVASHASPTPSFSFRSCVLPLAMTRDETAITSSGGRAAAAKVHSKRWEGALRRRTAS